MEKLFRRVFDYQRFSPNSRLSGMIEETEARYSPKALSDNDMAWLNAAGMPFQENLEDKDEEDK